MSTKNTNDDAATEGCAPAAGYAAHAVRWSLPPKGLIDQNSKWHWTLDGDKTLCGVRVNIIGTGERLLPECDDLPEKITCRRCKVRHTKERL